MVGGANATMSTATDRTTKYDNIRSFRQTDDPHDDPYYVYDEDGKRAKVSALITSRAMRGE